MARIDKRGLSALEALVTLGILAVLGSIVVPNYMRAKSRSKLMSCNSALRNMGTALEMYSTDWQGQYPGSVAQLTPGYLKTLPECPAAGSDTYSQSYRRTEDDPLRVVCPSHWGSSLELCLTRREELQTSLEGSTEVPEDIETWPAERTHCPGEGGLAYALSRHHFLVYCAGDHHGYWQAVPPDYPRYDSDRGLSMH